MSLASARLGSQWLALRLARRLLMSLCSGSAMDCGGGKQVLYIIIHWPYHYLVAYLARLICLGVFILSYINFIFIGIGKLQVYQVHQSNGNGRVCLRLLLVSGNHILCFLHLSHPDTSTASSTVTKPYLSGHHQHHPHFSDWDQIFHPAMIHNSPQYLCPRHASK